MIKVGGFEFVPGQQGHMKYPLIRIIPTSFDVDLAFCTPDLVKYNQEWTPLGHERWLREKRKAKENKDG